MNSPHSLLQSLLPEIKRNPQILGILAQSMGGGGQGVGGILGSQPPQALAGGPPMRQAPRPMPQAQPAPMTASAPRMGQGGPRASGWRDMARLLAAGIGDYRGGNDLAMLRDEWTKRDAGQQQQAQMAALQEQLAGLDGVTQEQLLLGQLDPEALLTMRAKANEPVNLDFHYGDNGEFVARDPHTGKPVVTEAGTPPPPKPGGKWEKGPDAWYWVPDDGMTPPKRGPALGAAPRVFAPARGGGRGGGGRGARPATGGGVSYSDIPAGGVVVR